MDNEIAMILQLNTSEFIAQIHDLLETLKRKRGETGTHVPIKPDTGANMPDSTGPHINMMTYYQVGND